MYVRNPCGVRAEWLRNPHFCATLVWSACKRPPPAPWDDAGAPPAEGGRWQFSLLERRWVRRSQPLAAPKTLLTTHACDAVLRDYC